MIRLLGVTLWLYLIVGCQPSQSQTRASQAKQHFVVDGSSTLNPMLVAAARRLAAEQPTYDIEVRQSSSGEGIKRFIAGSIPVAASSRGPKEAEYSQAAKNGRQLHLTTVAYDGLVVIVHRDNPVREFTEAQLRAVFFDGSATDWAQLGGGRKTGPVRVYAAPATQSGLTDFLAHRVTGKSDTPLVASAQSRKTDPDLIQAVADDPDGISIAALGRATSAAGRITVATISGVTPSERTVLKTEYPMARRVYVI